jgi:hypothetical protein
MIPFTKRRKKNNPFILPPEIWLEIICILEKSESWDDHYADIRSYMMLAHTCKQMYNLVACYLKSHYLAMITKEEIKNIQEKFFPNNFKAYRTLYNCFFSYSDVIEETFYYLKPYSFHYSLGVASELYDSFLKWKSWGNDRKKAIREIALYIDGHIHGGFYWKKRKRQRFNANFP